MLNGYPGLFDAMIAMQTMRAFLVEPPESVFVAQMHTAPVQGMAGKLGWRRLDEVPEGLMDAKIKSVDPADVPSLSTSNWFCCGVEALPVMAKWMEKTLDNPVLENKKTGERITSRIMARVDVTLRSLFGRVHETDGADLDLAP